uniref:Uncharacterized protein n=1 Tax=Aegilops tauschii subsp. strangulata TaxID=200361 RepID=A0A453H214_AEGTS
MASITSSLNLSHLSGSQSLGQGLTLEDHLLQCVYR